MDWNFNIDLTFSSLLTKGVKKFPCVFGHLFFLVWELSKSLAHLLTGWFVSLWQSSFSVLSRFWTLIPCQSWQISSLFFRLPFCQTGCFFCWVEALYMHEILLVKFQSYFPSYWCPFQKPLPMTISWSVRIIQFLEQFQSYGFFFKVFGPFWICFYAIWEIPIYFHSFTCEYSALTKSPFPKMFW